jgi:hypothetical protein
MPKLTIPQRQSNQDDATYAQIVQNSIREQRPYLSDDDIISLAQVKISTMPSVQPSAQPKAQAAPKVEVAKVEKPQPFKSTTEMVDLFVPKQQVVAPKTLAEVARGLANKKVVTDPMESGIVARQETIKKLPEQPAIMPSLGDPNVAAGTVRMLEKFIPPQQPKEQVAPIEVGGFYNPYDANLPTQENFDPAQAQRVRQNLPQAQSVRESFIAQPQAPQIDVFDVEAEKQLPKGSPNEKMVYADVLRKNDDKIKTFEASKAAAQTPTDDFEATINKKDLSFGNTQRASLMKAKLGGDMTAIESSLNEYQETPEFKRDVIKAANGNKAKFKEAAQLVLDNKANEYAFAPTKLQKKMQQFSDWAAVNNAPLYVTTKTLGAGLKGFSDVGAFGASLIGATRRSMEQILDGRGELTILDNFAAANAKAQKMSSGYIPQVQSEKASGLTQGLSDVTSIVAAIGAPMSVVKPVSIFGKAKNLLSLGTRGESAIAKGLSAEAAITTSGANKTLLEAAKVLQSKPANMVAQVLDGAATNWAIMGSSSFDAQRQKYLDMGFTEQQANRRAFGMTSLTNLLLAMPGVLRPHEASITQKIFSTGSKKETLKASLKQAAYFGGDMTLLRSIENTLDDNAKREQGIKIENTPFSELIKENGKKALVDAGAGFVMGLMARGKYKQSEMQLNGIVEAFKNPEQLSLDVQKDVANGRMTKEQAKTFQDFLTTIEPQYQKTLNETIEKNGKQVPKYNPQIAVKIAIEKTKSQQAAEALKNLNASVETKTIYETDKNGNIVEKTVYRHKDGKLYETEEASTKGRRISLLATKTNAEQRARRLEAGYNIENKLVAGWEMADLVDANSLNGKAKEGQREAIMANAPYEAVEINVNDFAKQPEIAELVSQIESGKLDLSNVEENNIAPPTIDAEGNVIDGKKVVANQIVKSAFERSGGTITFMKPITNEAYTEAANEAFESKVGDTAPITEGLPENEVIGVNAMSDAFDKVIENGGDAAEGLVEAAKEGLQTFVEPQVVAERLKDIKGEDTFSEPIIEAAVNKAVKAEPIEAEAKTVAQFIKNINNSAKILKTVDGKKVSNYVSKEGVEVTISNDEDGGYVNGIQVQGDIMLDFIGNDTKRGEGLATKELNKIIEEADKNNMSISLIVDSDQAVRGTKSEKGLTNKELKKWYESKGFIFDKDSRYGYKPKPTEDISVYKKAEYIAKPKEVTSENIEYHSSPYDLQEAFDQDRLKEGTFHEDGDGYIFKMENNKLKEVKNVKYIPFENNKFVDKIVYTEPVQDKKNNIAKTVAQSESNPALRDVESTAKALENIEKGLSDRKAILTVSVSGRDASVGDVTKIGIGNDTKIKLTENEKKEVKRQFKLNNDGDLTAAEFNQWRKEFSDKVLNRVKNEINNGNLESLLSKEQTPTEAKTVAQLRAEEKAEIAATDPNDKEALGEIYNRYDKLITPLLEKEKAAAREKGVKDMSVAEKMRQRAAKEVEVVEEVVEEKPIEEPNEEAVVETPKDLSITQVKHNRLAAIKKSYNALTKSKKSSEQGKTLMRQINGLATELGYEVGIKNKGDGSIKVLNSKGSDIKAIAVKSELPKPSNIEVERAKFLIEKGIAFYGGDVMAERTEFTSLTRAEVEKGVADIEKGKMTIPAIKLIKELNEMYESKTIPTIQGGGGSSTKRGSIELDKIVEDGFPMQLELTEKDIQFINENEATLAEEYDAWYEGLSNIEKLEHLNIVTDAKETENRKAEINASGEGKANVSNEKDASGKEIELSQKEKQLVKEEAKLSKLQQSLEVVGKENQFDIFGGKPSDSMLFKTSVSDAEKVYKAQKQVVDALKTEISDIKSEIQTAKDSEVTANQIAMELPEVIGEGFDFDKLFAEQEAETKGEKQKSEQELIEQEREDAYQKSSFSKKWAKTYSEAKEKLIEQYNNAKKQKEEIESKSIKSAGNKKVYVGSELDGQNVTIDYINKKRKDAQIKNAQSEMDSAKKDLENLGLTKKEIDFALEQSAEPQSKLEQASSFIRDAAAKLREQHQKDLDDPNALQRQGGLSKKQVAIALEKIADIIDAVGDAEKAIKQFLDGIKDPKERTEYEKEINNFFLEEYGEKEEVKPVPFAEIPKARLDEVMIEGEGKVDKTFANRVIESKAEEAVKVAVANQGLERVVDDFATAEVNANNLVEKYGYDIALSMAIEGEIDGAARSAILGMEYLRRDEAVRIAKTASELRKATEDLAEWVSYIGYLQAKTGSGNAYWAKFYADNPDLGLTLKDKINRWEETAGKAIPIDIKEKYEKLDAELKTALERVKELEAQKPSDEMMKAIKAIQEQEAKKLSKPNLTKEQRNRTSDKLMALAEKIRKSENSGLVLSTPIPPHIISDSVKLLAQGVKVGEAIGDTMAKIYKLIEGGIKKKLTEEEKKKVSDYFTSQLEENVETDSQTGNPITNSLIRDYVLQGFNTPEALLEKLMEHYPNKSEREVRDMVSKYGQEITKTADEIDREIRLIKNVFKTKSQLEDIAQGIRPKKRILPVILTPAEKAAEEIRKAKERKMVKDVRQALDNMEVDLPTLDNELRNKLDKQEATLSNKIKDLELAIKDGKEITKNEKTKLTSEEIEKLELQLEDTRKIYNEVFGKKPMTEGERKLKSLQTELENLYKEKEEVEKAEPKYTTSEKMDIEALQNEIAARKKALRLEGSEMQTAEEKRVEKLQKELNAIGKEKPVTEKEVIDRSQREKEIIKKIEEAKAKLAETKKIVEIDSKIAETEKKIQEQNFEAQKSQSKEYSDAVQKKIDELKDVRKNLNEAKKEFEKNLKTDEERRIEVLEKRLDNLKFGERKPSKEKIARTEKELLLLDEIAKEKELQGLTKGKATEKDLLETKLIAKEKQIQKLRDKRDGIETIEPEKQKTFNAEIDKLDAEAQELRKQIREQKPKEQKVPYSLEAVDSAIAANEFKLKGAQADLEVVRKRGQDTSKIEADIERYKNNAKTLEGLKTEIGKIEAKRVLQTFKNLAKRKEYYEQRKASGQYAKKPKNVLPLTTELTKALSEVDRLKFEEQKLLYLAEKQSMSGAAKVKDLAVGLWSVPRLALATGEWSFVGMQGRRFTASYLIKNPSVLKDAFKNAAKSWVSGEFAQEMESRIKNDPEYHIIKGSGLDLTEQSFKTAANEEIAYNNIGKIFWRFLASPFVVAEKMYKLKTGKDLGFIEKIDKFNPLVKFERAASGYLNTLRYAAMSDMVAVFKQEGLSFEKNKQDYKSAANYINSATGRGGSGIEAFQKNAEVLSKFFFSPKMFMTELQLGTSPLGLAYIASMKDPSNIAKREAFKHQLRYMSVLLSAGLSATIIAYIRMGRTDENDDGTGVEFNPASSNFGKIVFPNGRTVDFFNGAQRYIVLYDRLFGQKEFKNREGVIKDVGVKGSPSKYDIIMNIPKNKLNPALGFATGYLDAQSRKVGSEKYDDYGQVWDTEEELKKLSSPIFFQMVNNAYEQDPTILDGIGLFGAFFGKGFNVEEKKAPKPPKVRKRKSNYGFRYNP